MPSFTYTIEDFSPAIIYSPDWGQGSSTSDNQASKYSASSFFATSVSSGTASFTFNGTGVQLSGAKRGNHGLYQVTIDGTKFPAASGQSADPGIFQTSLFSKTDLSQGLHTVVLENQGGSGQFVDLDFITVHGNIGLSNELLSVATVEDDDTSFVYSPTNAWITNPDSLGFFSGSSGHATTTPGASFTYTFSVSDDSDIASRLDTYLSWFGNLGDGVSLYGPVGPAYSPFAVQLNSDSLSFTAQKGLNASQVMLYHADNLGPGPHTLKLLYQPSATGQVFAIDYAQVFNTPSTSDSSASSGSSSGLSGGAIAGLVIGLLFFASLLLLGLWWHLRRRRNNYSLSRRNILESELGARSKVLPKSYPDISGPAMYEHRVEPDTIQYPPAEDPQAVAPAATFMDFNSTHAASTEDARSEYISHYAPSTHSLTRSITNSTSPRMNASRASSLARGNSKGTMSTLPSSAGQSLSGIPVSQLQATRMVVNGRPQDFGAVEEESASASGSTVTLTRPHTYTEHHPPPDYHQATETFDLNASNPP
ncbi:hypothetical protein D9757_000534 [Collybiopsis confluens]|uniref:Transmembrane protein n=1 Tax=Collybiopsis confluens TaxID=2823264 RepID=A0A8H5MGP6_9AGAR|nr:hypothetical protein D9757_000534 [Collybiopsis confluens]